MPPNRVIYILKFSYIILYANNGIKNNVYQSIKNIKLYAEGEKWNNTYFPRGSSFLLKKEEK